MRFALVIFIALAFIPTNASADEVEQVTEEFCKCAGTMFKDMNKMMDLVKSGDMTKLQEMQANIIGQQAEVQSCMKAIDEKYSPRKEDQEFQAKVKASIEKKCPPPKLPAGAQN